MRSSSVLFGVAALLAPVSGETYKDKLGRKFSSNTVTNGITYGFMVPKGAVAPFDVIVQVTAPIDLGWSGLAWGGGMTYNPLAVVWTNGDKVKISSRMAYGYSPPPPYSGAKYTLLEGSYTNKTHFVVTALCEGCSTWASVTGEEKASLNPNAENPLAFAFSTSPVNEPSNVDTEFNMHSSVGHFTADFAAAQADDFDEWAARTLPGDDKPPATTASPTNASPTTADATTAPSATGTNGGAVGIPKSCGKNAAFPLVAAKGWSYVKLLGSLTTPRGVAVDSKGNLVIVENRKGVTVHTFGTDGCISSSKTLINNPQLNHGIAFTPDGSKLVVSSIAQAWRYDYDVESQTVSNQQLVVKGMHPKGHPTRTAVIPPDTPNLLILSLGSDGNLDMPSIDKNVGRALVKVFDLSKVPNGGYDYNTQGWFLGYGLRNEVAIAIDGNNKAWGVENSADDFKRIINGVSTDIHHDNPAEELNYLGDPSVSNENWYGYPTCFTVWGGSQFPNSNPKVGSQFTPEPNSTFNDDTCAERSVPPRLSFQAHSAPLDAKFDKDSSNLYVTFHGSWNRNVPTGYKVVSIPFTKGASGFEPVAAQDSHDAAIDILWDPQEGCSSSKCFRPSGLVWDKGYTRMFIASDNSQQGELYMLAKTG